MLADNVARVSRAPSLSTNKPCFSHYNKTLRKALRYNDDIITNIFNCFFSFLCYFTFKGHLRSPILVPIESPYATSICEE